MEAPERSTDSGSRTERRWHKGCAAALSVFAVLGLVLGLLGLWGLSELEKGLDGYGQLEETDYGASGSVADPLAPGAIARYEDGLRVTVSEPRWKPEERIYCFTVTYENERDESLIPGGGSADESASEYGPAPLVVRAGEPLDDYGPDDGSTSDWLNRLEAGAELLSPLGAGERVAVPVRVTGSAKGTPITVEVVPPDDSYRETAYWKLTLG
ncbi:hypothetical protein ACIOJD_05410 [Streptomyces sp. NPDC088116]|uniref:hypothetical protein n=1 Tax=Streptomyces sp. NPDC088116 TaxID=3365825 RepID=UPI0037F90733